jgi:hypothetical protein
VTLWKNLGVKTEPLDNLFSRLVLRGIQWNIKLQGRMDLSQLYFVTIVARGLAGLQPPLIIGHALGNGDPSQQPLLFCGGQSGEDILIIQRIEQLIF